MNKPYLKVIALDFDGTIVESNHIKDRAFDMLFSEWPMYRDSMMQWHLAHNEIDRNEKFRYFVRDVLGFSQREDLIEELITRFGHLTNTAIIDSPFVDGANQFLDYFHGKVKIYLVSATPQHNLDFIINKRDLGMYFEKVYGAPIDKGRVLREIISFENISSNNMLFIGDCPEDQKSADCLSINFIGRQSDRKLETLGRDIFDDFHIINQFVQDNYELHR